MVDSATELTIFLRGDHTLPLSLHATRSTHHITRRVLQRRVCLVARREALTLRPVHDGASPLVRTYRGGCACTRVLATHTPLEEFNAWCDAVPFQPLRMKNTSVNKTCSEKKYKGSRRPYSSTSDKQFNWKIKDSKRTLERQPSRGRPWSGLDHAFTF